MCSNAQGSNASQVVALPRWLPARHSVGMRALVLLESCRLDLDPSRSATWQIAACMNTWSRSAAITCWQLRTWCSRQHCLRRCNTALV
jgi:hypothetical protein